MIFKLSSNMGKQVCALVGYKLRCIVLFEHSTIVTEVKGGTLESFDIFLHLFPCIYHCITLSFLQMRNNDSCYKGCPNASTLLTHRQGLGLSEGSCSSIDAPVPQAPPPPPPPPPVPAPPPPPLACLKKNQVVHN